MVHVCEYATVLEREIKVGCQSFIFWKDKSFTFNLSMKIAYACRSSWHWVFKEAFEGAGTDFRDVRVVKSLRLLRKEFGADCGQRKGPSTFSFATTTTNDDGEAAGTSTIYTGDSEVFEDLEDKDDFVRSVTEAGAEGEMRRRVNWMLRCIADTSTVMLLLSTTSQFLTSLAANYLQFLTSLRLSLRSSQLSLWSLR